MSGHAYDASRSGLGTYFWLIDAIVAPEVVKGIWDSSASHCTEDAILGK